MIARARLVGVALVIALAAIAPPAVFAHTDPWNGGPENNTKDGHEHRDEMTGGGGHDSLGGLADGDYMEGNAGNDDVRGMGNGDSVVVWFDGGGDVARGGDGSDHCWVDPFDTRNDCEVTTQP